DDGGTPIGAALLGYAKLCKAKGTTPRFDLPKDMYLGLGFTDEDCEKAAKASGMPFRKMANVADEAAQLLTEGKIIGRFSGREEVGPRALGNRSLLADARDLRVIRKLNFAIKQRDFWMPFAASVLEEDAPRYIKNLTGWAYYMIEAFDTTPAGFNDLCAGTHPFDQTIRPQLVNELNPEYRDLIRAFKARTGVGGLLNTSFNLHGSPIVGTPEVAIDTLARSELDAVVLGSYLISKKPRVD
ncbi:MAG TPA: carbamoyltransferase C-terminal domain-containing protein, partial [Gemmatales bacterium]|nr:carbamoyltransferase C-terminal domain-containing protein [Gemmatales bacterium]